MRRKNRGICDVLIANGKIIAVASNIPSDIVPDCTVVDLSGQILCPGFIDQHVHLIGGGGEAGPTTRHARSGVKSSDGSGRHVSGWSAGYRLYLSPPGIPARQDPCAQ
ncbi:isoaspartyl dipeptidase [Escherichia coli]|uniref:Isoaspartyl dipeptidase n=1 Tax=Escherichia coli TaxID=562 RepID=A0A377KD39_ECOLX|nr:isoaspartyl dipeptidase [Escherichia coli]